MIVEDKQKTIDNANEIAAEMMGFVSEKILKTLITPDPAEQIYLTLHIIGNFVSKSILALEGYSKIYNIEKLNKKKLENFVKVLIDEYLSAGKMGHE